MLHNLKLQLTDRRENWIALAFIGVVQNLHSTFFAQFIHAFAEILEGGRIGIAQPTEDLRTEAGNALVLNFRSCVKGVTDREHAWIVQTNHVTGIGILHNGPVLTKQLLRT